MLLLILPLLGCGDVTNAFEVTLKNVSAPGDLSASDGNDYDIVMAPGLFFVHEPGFVLFTAGEQATYEGLEQIAEDGDPSALRAALEVDSAVVSVTDLSTTDQASYAAAPIFPGDAVNRTVKLTNTQSLSMVFMYAESNDVLVGVLDHRAHDGRDPLDLDLSDKVRLYDMGTEVNEEPAIGDNQPGRQSGPNTGDDEDGVIQTIDGADDSGFTYPAPGSFVGFTVSPKGGS